MLVQDIKCLVISSPFYGAISIAFSQMHYSWKLHENYLFYDGDRIYFTPIQFNKFKTMVYYGLMHDDVDLDCKIVLSQLHQIL